MLVPNKNVNNTYSGFSETRAIRDSRLTICNYCNRGVFTNQDYTRCSVGIVHTECLEDHETQNVT